MPKDYTKEQFLKLYEKLPQELKEAIFSEKTAESIWEVCAKNKIEGDKISEVARYTGRVLLGILPPGKFQEALEKELGVKKEVAKKATQEINRFIFFPVKNSLEELFKIEITPPAPTKAVPPAERKAKLPPKKDVYRELVG